MTQVGELVFQDTNLELILYKMLLITEVAFQDGCQFL